MKIPFPGQQTILPPALPPRLRPFGGRPPRRRAGVALVITLIMLSVITFMAITFLVLSHRERSAVTTTTDLMMARQAADSAMDRGLAELVQRMLVTTNDQDYDLIVSTNFINPLGHRAGGGYNPTNVNYDYLTTGNPLGPPAARQNLANLLYNPRAPVWVSNDFRYYLDLNRNGRFDTNGFLPLISDDLTRPYIDLNGNLTATFNPTNVLMHHFVGDPEWIGVLEYPERPHSADNKFLSRWCYIVLPAGKMLDLNYIHNEAALLRIRPRPPRGIRFNLPNNDGFVRNQGVGTWEINLAAFLADLNPGAWNRDNRASRTYYQYWRPNSANLGWAFYDAGELIAWRYMDDYTTLTPARFLFPDDAVVLRSDGIDQYSDGALGLLTGPLDESTPQTRDPVNMPWLGADNPRRMFTIQDFFDPAKLPDFSTRLRQLGLYTNSFDRYTYYRMLAQLGTDTAPPPNRMHLNYVNIDLNGKVLPDFQTNLLHWTPSQFFTNAADRMLRAVFTNITVTNIPVFLNRQVVYSPAIHRLLQLSANLYEATTNSFYPSMYRPLFRRSGDIVFITGFEEVDPADRTFWSGIAGTPIDLTERWDSISPTRDTHVNVYGIPWIIGARKGFPNINEITVETRSQMTRRMMVHRPTLTETDRTKWSYRQLLDIAVSNYVGVEAWNSYHTNFVGPDGRSIPVTIEASGDVTYELTNSSGFSTGLRRVRLAGLAFTNNWPGFGPMSRLFETDHPVPGSFVIPLRTNYGMVPIQTYSHAQRRMIPLSTNYEPVVLNAPPLIWGLNVTNRLRVMMRESSSGRVLDYVQFAGPSSAHNVTDEIMTRNRNDLFEGLWNTNVTSIGLPEGMQYQLNISRDTSANSTYWNYYGIDQGTKIQEIENFNSFYAGNSRNKNLDQPVPFTPTRYLSHKTSWQANDPLVHYTAGDLLDPIRYRVYEAYPPGDVASHTNNIGMLNDRYDPWGGPPALGESGDPNAFNMTVKDPMVVASDLWDFPTNKFPNLGWIGRVHRGTPWQTVYLKSSDTLATMAGINNWTNWSGAMDLGIAEKTAPITDRMLLELFTTAPNQNADQGRMSVNQTNIAAWSAVLSGLLVITNSAADYGLASVVMQPAGPYDPANPPPVARIVQGIQRTLWYATNEFGRRLFPKGTFNSMGDVLATPELSDQSPFLFLGKLTDNTKTAGGLSDAVVERIPQQILSLLTFNPSPRFVIYAYGQTLHPAQRSIVTASGPYFGLCTNYQVTAETAMRAVVRIDGSFDSTNAVPWRPYPPKLVVEQFNVLPPD